MEAIKSACPKHMISILFVILKIFLKRMTSHRTFYYVGIEE